MARISVKFISTWALFCGVVLVKGEWCELKCKHQEENTMCEYEEKTTTENGKPVKNVMTPKIREDLLKMHNEFRNKIAGGGLKGWPSAGDMMELSWDDDLAKSAQRWASQCPTGHDACRRTPNFEAVGQNLAWSWTTGRFGKMDMSISGWTDEADLASTDLVDNYQFEKNTGHFTQVVWAKTIKIGCGLVTYEKDGLHWKFLACNYGPSGNYISQRMYTRGEPCSACPEGSRCNPESDFPHLCS